MGARPMSKIILGVTGGIAAYKACELLRRIQGAGHDVTVVPTVAALEFIGATTWSALSGHPVHTGVFDDAHLVPHVKLGQETDLVVVAPATADLLARAASGRADDLLTNVLLTTRAPVIFAPAMHTEMWLHPATQANVATLRDRGAVVVDPDSGRLTGPDSGPGRLPEPAELAAVVSSILAEPRIASGPPAGTWRVSASRSVLEAPGSISIRCASSGIVFGPHGLGPGPCRRTPRRRGPPGRCPRVRATAGQCGDRAGRLDRRSGRRDAEGGHGCRHRGDGRSPRRLHSRQLE